jgi:elongation factor 1 alpha-like protein
MTLSTQLIIFKVVIHRGRIDEPAIVDQIVSLIDKSDGRIIKRKPRCESFLVQRCCDLLRFRHIPIGGAAIVQLRLTNKRGIPIEPFEVNRNLGRVVLRNEGVTIGAGRFDFGDLADVTGVVMPF